MIKGQFNEEKILSAMQELKLGRKVTEVSRELGVSRATLYLWKAKYNRQISPNNSRCQQLEAENQKLKQIIGELCLEIGRPVKALLNRAPEH
jgi:putative transposase